MPINFNNLIDRRNTNSIKWDYNEEIFGQADVLPLWIADMDFHSPEAVVNNIIKRTEHGLFGYTGKSETYLGVVKN